jgi:N-acetylneuraminate lyase
VVVHVGHNSQTDARALAAHAARLGVDAVAALAPSYFRPAGAEALADFLAPVAAAAPGLPFYFYDIPALTGVSLSMPDFLRRGRDRIPNLAGVKFTNSDLAQLQECLLLEGKPFDILFGIDECLLAGLALGVRGAVGSTYNFAPGIYLRILRAFADGDLAAARAEQAKSIRLVRLLSRHGYMGAAKALMGLLGIDCGPVRPPLRALAASEAAELRRELEESGLWAELARAGP